MSRLLLLSSLITLLICTAGAQTPRDVSVELAVKITGNKYVISWPADNRATAYQVSKRVAGASSWGSPVSMTAAATSFTDSTLTPGKLYEFRVRKSLTVGSAINAWGYVYGGVNVEHSVSPGRVILVIDNTYANDLSTELLRLEDDLTNEGWLVRPLLVDRAWHPRQVKDSIATIAAKERDVTAVFLFGHVPVPYSGMIVPDGHVFDHLMPWPADGYYGDDADWLDELDYDTSFIFQGQQGLDTAIIPPANRNFADDGRFDHSSFPDPIDYMVGRVDLAGMTHFTKNEKELLRQYLDKDHAYRTGQLTAPPRALVDDNFGLFSVNEAFASSAWRAFPQLVGRDSIYAANDWFTTLPNDPYLWAYGCGGGWNEGAGGIGNTSDFATKGSKAIFTMLFGSYFGDWDHNNNFLRAPLATEYGLSCTWSGRPYWYFQPMAIGMPIGYSALITQNNTGTYATGPSPGGVHVALMGDPTLKMHVIKPPTNLAATNEGFDRVRLTWIASGDPSIEGYRIYKAHEPDGVFLLSNATLIQGTEYLDTTPFSGKNVYRVHAVRTEVTPAGSYINLSPASRTTIDGIQSGVDLASAWQPASLRSGETSYGTEFSLSLTSAATVRLVLYNSLGAVVKVFDERTLTQGTYDYTWSQSEKDRAAPGVYFAVAEVGGKIYRVKTLNIR